MGRKGESLGKGFGPLYSLHPDDKNIFLEFYLKVYTEFKFCTFGGTSESYDSQVRGDFCFQMQTLRFRETKWLSELSRWTVHFPAGRRLFISLIYYFKKLGCMLKNVMLF